MFGEENQTAQTISLTTMGVAKQFDSRERAVSIDPPPVSPLLSKMNENDAILGGLIGRLNDLEKRLDGVLGPHPPLAANKAGHSIPEPLPSNVLYRLSDQTRGLEIASSIVSRINERLLL